MENQIKCEHCEMMLKNTPKGVGSHMGYYHKNIVAANKVIVEFTISCLECNRLVANSNNVLGRHVRKEHGLEYPDYLVKYEHDGVWPVCKCGCGEKVKWHLGGFSKFFSKACSSKGEHNGMFGRRGENSPNFGKIRTAEMRENYSRAQQERWENPLDKRHEIMKGDEYRQKMSVSNKLSYSTTNRAERVSDGCKKWWQDHPEARIEKRKLAIRLLAEGKIGPQAPFKAEWVFNPFTEQNEYMHSSWETAFLQKCVLINLPITKKHDITIPYVHPHDGETKEYIPDFLDLNDPVIYEVKGQVDDVDLAKAAAARIWCAENGYTYEMIFEKV